MVWRLTHRIGQNLRLQLRPALIARHQRDDRREIAAGAVAEHTDPSRIAAEFLDRRSSPDDRFVGVLDRRREFVFWRQTIARGDHDHPGFVGERAARLIRDGDAAADPAAAMIIDHHRKRPLALRHEHPRGARAVRARDRDIVDRGDLFGRLLQADEGFDGAAKLLDAHFFERLEPCAFQRAEQATYMFIKSHR